MKFSFLLIAFLVLSSCATAQDDSETDSHTGEDSISTTRDAGVITGVYASGFEASILHPCDEPGEQWWMSLNAEFSERYRAMIDPATESRGYRGPYVLVRVEGDKTEVGEYGHLGAYSRELTVTVLIGMREVDSEPEGNVMEWVASVCEEGF